MQCIKGNEVCVLRSGAGYYIGTVCDDGPYCRISQDYWKKREDAQKALDTLCFNDRSYAMETQFCNGGRGCFNA